MTLKIFLSLNRLTAREQPHAWRPRTRSRGTRVGTGATARTPRRCHTTCHGRAVVILRDATTRLTTQLRPAGCTVVVLAPRCTAVAGASKQHDCTSSTSPPAVGVPAPQGDDCRRSAAASAHARGPCSRPSSPGKALFPKIQRVFKIPRHIESCGTCMKH